MSVFISLVHFITNLSFDNVYSLGMVKPYFLLKLTCNSVSYIGSIWKRCLVKSNVKTDTPNNSHCNTSFNFIIKLQL